ncbi:MAG: hypothetical protein IT507_17695 [Burkholderiaceae bacterium]|nr:hypothetical protein [Burkholderiaceae bacterium]
MKKALLLPFLAFALVGCNQSKVIDFSTRAYACPRGANPGTSCKGPLVFVGNLYIRVDETDSSVQIHAEPKGDSGLLTAATVQFPSCNIQNRLNWSCDEGNLMTAYYRYIMRNGVFHADWATPGDAGKLPVVAISGPMRWLYRFGFKTADSKLLAQSR